MIATLRAFESDYPELAGIDAHCGAVDGLVLDGVPNGVAATTDDPSDTTGGDSSLRFRMVGPVNARW